MKIRGFHLENIKRNSCDYKELVDLMMWAKLTPGAIVKDDIGFSHGSVALSDEDEHHGMLSMNIINCLHQGMGIYYHTDFSEDSFYHAFRYGDLAMLELMGDIDAYYPYDIDWSTEKLGASMIMDKDFAESIEQMTYQDEYQPLFPFNSREPKKKSDIGIENQVWVN